MMTKQARKAMYDIEDTYGIKVLFNRDTAFIQTDRFHLEKIFDELNLKYCNDWDRKKHCDAHILSIG